MLFDSELDVVVTGAGGWIGQAVLEMLDSALGDSFPTRVHVYGQNHRTLRLRSGRQLVSEPLGSLRDLSIGPHLLAHLAFVTREHTVTQSTASYVALNEAISSAVLDHARRTDVEGVFLPSSGAVYGPAGSPDADLVTNPYGALKLRDESRFAEVSSLKERTAIVRVFNLAGPFINKTSIYALGSIITDLKQGGPITLRADHPVIRSYVHVRDLVELAFALMMGRTAGPGTPFDTAGDREIEIAELAALTASLLGMPDVQINRPSAVEGALSDRYVGDSTLMGTLASHIGVDLAPLDIQILDTAAFMQESPNLPGR
jgi:nucleoside-diphosphate-sugar epimerase